MFKHGTAYKLLGSDEHTFEGTGELHGISEHACVKKKYKIVNVRCLKYTLTQVPLKTSRSSLLY